MSKSEEDIKIKIVMPFLKEMGFDESELSFEQGFAVVLPRFSVRVDTEKQIELSRPRLDILVRREGKNLFVVEVKRDSKELTDEDKWQAIQYARLVNPMAPIAVVTNGKTIKFYKVFDGSEIEKDKATILGYKITDGTESIYQEAFEYFVGLSEENICLFSKAQIEEGMKTLRGSKDDFTKKFIPDLYVASQKLDEAIDQFLSSDKPVFSLIGESGVGKTCSMCALAIDLVEKKYPVLFYKAQDLIPDLNQAISNDLNWEFNAQNDPIVLLKKLAKILKNEKLIIFVDGVDEWNNPEKIGILGKFASSVRNRNFKLVISCKSGQWQKFLTDHTPTALSHEIFAYEDEKQGYALKPFDKKEFHYVIKKYRSFYGFNGLFEKDVLEECRRLPFLLRIFFEVAKNTGKSHLTFSIKEFYDQYRKKVIEGLPHDDQDISEGILKELARLICNENTDIVEEETLRNVLGLSAVESIPVSLFESNILEKTSDGLDTNIGFYFKKFRDYIIAFGVKKWDKISVDAFQNEWKNLDTKSVGADAIVLFYQLTDDVEKKKVIDGIFRVNAERYLNYYVQVLDEHFSNLKYRFSPYTQGDIGLVCFFTITEMEVVACGFRKVNEGDEEVTFIPVEAGWDSKPNLQFILGVEDFHYFSASGGFRGIDIKKVVLENEVTKPLKEIFREGRLNENSNYYLSLEKALGVIVKYQSDFHGIKDEMKVEQCLPINIDKVEGEMRLEKARKHFWYKIVEEKKEEALLNSDWSGSGISFDCSLTEQDNEKIEEQAKNVVNDKELVKSMFYRDVESINAEEVLSEALEAIKHRKQTIDESPTASARRSKTFTKERFSQVAHRLYSLFLEEYRGLIEHNFPSLKNEFWLYSKMPVHYFLIIESNEKEFVIKYFICRNHFSKKNEVTFCVKENFIYDGIKNTFELNGQSYTLLSHGWRFGDSILFPYEVFINTDISRRFTILRSMVYQQIEGELEVALKRLPILLS